MGGVEVISNTQPVSTSANISSPVKALETINGAVHAMVI